MAAPIYTYYPTVPQGATPFNNTQAPILSNFQAIAELLAVNHGAFNTENFGKHTYCTLPSRSELPPVTPTDGALYCSTTTDTYGYGLYYEYPDGTTTSEITNQTSELAPDSGISNTIVMQSGFVICRAQVNGSNANPTTFLASIGGSTNPPFKKSPIVGISQISGGYSPYTRRGAYNTTQTGYTPNISSNNFWSFVAFGF